MSQKQEKKIRQLYRKDIGKKAKEQQKAVQARIEEQLKNLDQIMKPAPKLIPEFIWVSLQRIFLNI
jgi:hypothetical protein